MIVPTLRVVTQLWTLRVLKTPRCQAWRGDAERHGMHAHAARGNDHPADCTRSGTGFSREEAVLALTFIDRISSLWE
jgi:hypothetical protein